MLPAALLVLGLCLAALSAAATNIANTSVARDAARSLSRGSTEEDVTAAVALARPQASLAIERTTLAVCVRLREVVPAVALIEALPPMEVSACAVRE